jgi:endoglucanase
MNKTELNEICSLYATSSDEKSAREYIISKIKDYADYSIDPLGNILAFKKGKNKPDKKIMLASHMDEVGFIITSINSDGTLKFAPVGGINADVVIGRQLYIPSADIFGVTGTKPIHRLDSDERKKAAEFSKLYIDIGTKSKKESEKIINLGDLAYFVADFKDFGSDRVVSKAIDDRAGCLMLIDYIRSEVEFDTHILFSVQEEIGLRGASTGAYSINPDYAIVIETTTAADLDDTPDTEKVCSLSDGAVILYRDARTMYDRELYKLAVKTADENNIKWQTKTKIAGGNDAGSIQISRSGVKTIAVSVPCRYLHSPSTMMDLNDYDEVYKLMTKLVGEIAKI